VNAGRGVLSGPRAPEDQVDLVDLVNLVNLVNLVCLLKDVFFFTSFVY
jgi:hypothetical protein